MTGNSTTLTHRIRLPNTISATSATMNDTATTMNQDAGNAQMACANAGTHA